VSLRRYYRRWSSADRRLREFADTFPRRCFRPLRRPLDVRNLVGSLARRIISFGPADTFPIEGEGLFRPRISEFLELLNHQLSFLDAMTRTIAHMLSIDVPRCLRVKGKDKELRIALAKLQYLSPYTTRSSFCARCMTAARRPFVVRAPRNLPAADGGSDTSVIRLNTTAIFSSDQRNCRQQSGCHSGEIGRKAERVK